MKLSKIPVRILVLILVLVQFLSVASCQKAGDKGGDTSDYTTSPDENVEIQNILEIVKNGKSEYTITYSKSMPYFASLAQRLSTVIFMECGILIPVSAFAVEGKKQILVGAFPENEDYSSFRSTINESKDFAVAVSGGSLILYASNEQYSVNLIFKFLDLIKDREDKKTLTFSEKNNYIYSKTEDLLAEVNSLEYVEEYKAMFNTYGSYAEEQLSAEKYSASKSDQTLINALKKRLGESMVIYIGDTRAIYKGFFCKLDTEDYTNAAIRSGDHILIPGHFAREYFGDDISVDSQGYFNVSEYCNSNSGYSLYINEEKLCIIYPPDVKPFDNKDSVTEGYTNQRYLERLNEFFTDEFLPEPVVNTEQSRVVIAQTDYPQNVADWRNQKYVTNFSPSIAVNTVDGQKTIYASYEYSTVVNTVEITTYTALSVSTDDGKTWREIASVNDLRWASLFILNDTVYLMGNSLKTGSAMIARLKSDCTFETAILADGTGGGAPCTVTVHNGRIYKAYGKILSADITNDLLFPGSWTQSTHVNTLINETWYKQAANDPKSSYKIAAGEGNVVIGPDGTLYGIYRINTNSMDGYAAIVHISNDGKTLSYVESCNSLITMGTSRSKFTVRYDETSGLYYSLVSTPTIENQHFQRTVLSLVYSEDLINWKTATSVLVDRELMNEDYAAICHGFQYCDFVFDGEDIIMVVREATGYTNYFHDGKYTTFYRIENFRKLVA